MKLLKKHRDALIQELESAQEDLCKQNESLKLFGDRTIESYDPDMTPFFEVGKHLAQQRIEEIKACLIEDELFNF